MLGQQSLGVTVALLDDPVNFGVDQFGGCLAIRLVLKRRWQAGVLGCDKADRTELLAHPPSQDHLSGDLRDLL